MSKANEASPATNGSDLERLVSRQPRYVLHPGYVYSKNDGDRHFIGGPRLAQLYGVDIRDCVFGDVPQYSELPGDIHLRPSRCGNYTLAVTYRR